MNDVVGVVLAAGSGTRLRPLTEIVPKALCPVDNKALLDSAIDAVEPLTARAAVNAWHLADQVVNHVGRRAHVSVEPEPLGTAGALGNLASWIDGHHVLVHNADSWQRADMKAFVDGWDRQRVRLLVQRNKESPDFDDWRFCGVSLLPSASVQRLTPVPTGLWECMWVQMANEGALDLVYYDGPFFDCGTPADYLEANLVASGKQNIVHPTAVVDGSIDQCVIWPNARVDTNESLRRVVRAPGVTVQC